MHKFMSKCDGKLDCVDHSDEQECASCGNNTFPCKN